MPTATATAAAAAAAPADLDEARTSSESSVFEVTARTADGGSTRRLWTSKETATSHGLTRARAWLAAELGTDPVLEEVDSLQDRVYHYGDPDAPWGEGPTVEIAEWHVHDGTETGDE